MNKKTVKTIARGGVLALAGLMLFSLLAGAGNVPPEAFEAAQSRGYALMEIEGIPGPVQIAQYEGHIEVIDIDFGVVNQGNTGASGDPRRTAPRFAELSVTKEIDMASPLISLHCAQGQSIPKVTINLMPFGSTPPEYYVIELTNAVITKVKNRLVYKESGQGYAHLETVTFKYAEIIWKNVDPHIEMGWDLLHDEAI